MNKRKRIKVNGIWMGWSNGVEVRMQPSVSQQVSDYGRAMGEYLWRVEEGYEMNCGSEAVARAKSRCLEYEADRYWNQGEHLKALNQMLWAAQNVLPDYEPEFEDVHWLDPQETIYWHPNVKEFQRLAHRCQDYCRRDPRLWPLYNGSQVDHDYRTFMETLNRWLHTC